MTRTYEVDPGAADQRLDVFLAGVCELSRSQLQRLVRQGQVEVNSLPARTNYVVQAGDRVVLDQPVVEAVPVEVPDIPVIYEDDDLLVIDKPAGLTVHAGSATAGTATVADFARPRTSDPDPERPGIVHRLDRDTSGLMVIAKNLPAKAYLQDQFRQHAVRKTYHLLAVGRVEPAEAVIKLPLERDPGNPLRRAVVRGGRPAVTKYQTLADFPGYSFVEARPETGRTHQLRVHFAALGHPIAGDALYGNPRRPLGLDRQFLHASGLEFTSPSEKQLGFTSQLPPALQAVIARLEQL